MSKRYFTSETHFYHRKILQYCPDSRPFDSIEQMNEGLVERWNETVGVQDDIYHLGDFSFGTREQTEQILSRLKGNIHLIRGNHDRAFDSSVLRNYLASIQDYKEFPTKKFGIALIMFHFRILDWNKKHYGSWHLFGHAHGNSGHHETLATDRCMDVGIDTRADCSPWSWDEIKEKLDNNELT